MSGASSRRRRITNATKRNNRGDNVPKNNNLLQNIDYNQLKDALIEANAIIRETEETEKKKRFENDALSIALVEMLRLVFGIIIGLLSLIALVVMVFSVCEVYTTPNYHQYWDDTLALWLIYGCGAVSMLYLTTKMPIKKQKWLPVVLGITTVVPVCIATVIDIFVVHEPQLISGKMIASGVLIIIVGFLLFLIRAVKSENDRNYLVSYFSALMALVALVVASVTLVVQLSTMF